MTTKERTLFEESLTKVESLTTVLRLMLYKEIIVENRELSIKFFPIGATNLILQDLDKIRNNLERIYKLDQRSVEDGKKRRTGNRTYVKKRKSITYTPETTTTKS